MNNETSDDMERGETSPETKRVKIRDMTPEQLREYRRQAYLRFKRRHSEGRLKKEKGPAKEKKKGAKEVRVKVKDMNKEQLSEYRKKIRDRFKERRGDGYKALTAKYRAKFRLKLFLEGHKDDKVGDVSAFILENFF